MEPYDLPLYFDGNLWPPLHFDGNLWPPTALWWNLMTSTALWWNLMTSHCTLMEPYDLPLYFDGNLWPPLHFDGSIDTSSQDLGHAGPWQPLALPPASPSCSPSTSAVATLAPRTHQGPASLRVLLLSLSSIKSALHPHQCLCVFSLPCRHLLKDACLPPCGIPLHWITPFHRLAASVVNF